MPVRKAKRSRDITVQGVTYHQTAFGDLRRPPANQTDVCRRCGHVAGKHDDIDGAEGVGDCLVKRCSCQGFLREPEWRAG